eukprot:Gb_40745 [translate_table: standard]
MCRTGLWFPLLAPLAAYRTFSLHTLCFFSGLTLPAMALASNLPPSSHTCYDFLFWFLKPATAFSHQEQFPPATDFSHQRRQSIEPSFSHKCAMISSQQRFHVFLSAMLQIFQLRTHDVISTLPLLTPDFESCSRIFSQILELPFSSQCVPSSIPNCSDTMLTFSDTGKCRDILL